MTRFSILTTATLALVCSAFLAEPARPDSHPQQQQALDIYKELVEINTVTGNGDTGSAADAWRRPRAAGFDAADVQVFKPAQRKRQSGSLSARHWRAQADPAARPSRCGRGEAETGRSIRSS